MILCNTFPGLYSTKKEKVLKNLFKNCFNLAKILSMFKVFWITITLTIWSTYKKERPYCRYQYSTHGKNRPDMLFGDKTQRVEFRVLKMRSLCV